MKIGKLMEIMREEKKGIFVPIFQTNESLYLFVIWAD